MKWHEKEVGVDRSGEACRRVVFMRPDDLTKTVVHTLISDKITCFGVVTT